MNCFDTLEDILKYCRKMREEDPDVLCDHVLFLDYDGVINTEGYDIGIKPFDLELVKNVKNLCEDYDLKIVVTSSYRYFPDYADRLVESGLGRNIVILGKVQTVGSRENDIKQYLLDHVFIDYFIVIDDTKLEGFETFQIKTKFSEGFNHERYEKARMLLERLKKAERRTSNNDKRKND